MMRAEECLGRSRWIARSATNRAFNVASLFVLPLFPLARARPLFVVGRSGKKALIGRALWSVGTSSTRPSPVS